jgi:hypothetical protein
MSHQHLFRQKPGRDGGHALNYIII